MKTLKAKDRKQVDRVRFIKISFSIQVNLYPEINTYSMGGHLAVFAKILSSNQLCWDSFSSLEKPIKLL